MKFKLKPCKEKELAIKSEVENHLEQRERAVLFAENVLCLQRLRRRNERGLSMEWKRTSVIGVQREGKQVQPSEGGDMGRSQGMEALKASLPQPERDFCTQNQITALPLLHVVSCE